MGMDVGTWHLQGCCCRLYDVDIWKTWGNKAYAHSRGGLLSSSWVDFLQKDNERPGTINRQRPVALYEVPSSSSGHPSLYQLYWEGRHKWIEVDGFNCENRALETLESSVTSGLLCKGQNLEGKDGVLETWRRPSWWMPLRRLILSFLWIFLNIQMWPIRP